MGGGQAVRLDGPLRHPAAARGRLLAVHPSHTGQGLGQRVCQFVTSSLLTLYGTCALFVENYNAPAIALYRKLGFAYRDVTTLLPAV